MNKLFAMFYTLIELQPEMVPTHHPYSHLSLFFTIDSLVKKTARRRCQAHPCSMLFLKQVCKENGGLTTNKTERKYWLGIKDVAKISWPLHSSIVTPETL